MAAILNFARYCITTNQDMRELRVYDYESDYELYDYEGDYELYDYEGDYELYDYEDDYELYDYKGSTLGGL